MASLIVQALGVLAVGWVLTRLPARRLAPLKRFPLVGIGVVVSLVAGVSFFIQAYETTSTLPASTAIDAKASLFAAEHAADPQANNAFLVWARDTMLARSGHGARRGTYYLAPPTILANPELGQWSTYELLPERATNRLGEAEWIVFYGIEPHMSPEVHRVFDRTTEYAPSFALAQRSNAN